MNVKDFGCSGAIESNRGIVSRERECVWISKTNPHYYYDVEYKRTCKWIVEKLIMTLAKISGFQKRCKLHYKQTYNCYIT